MGVFSALKGVASRDKTHLSELQSQRPFTFASDCCSLICGRSLSQVSKWFLASMTRTSSRTGLAMTEPGVDAVLLGFSMDFIERLKKGSFTYKIQNNTYKNSHSRDMV